MLKLFYLFNWSVHFLTKATMRQWSILSCYHKLDFISDKQIREQIFWFLSSRFFFYNKQFFKKSLHNFKEASSGFTQHRIRQDLVFQL